MTPGCRPLVLGNWKMHLTASEAAGYTRALLPRLGSPVDREVAIAPAFPALTTVGALLKGSAIQLAAQDLFWEDEGPYTGEVSGVMLQDAGVSYVLVAHSERRRHLEESDRVASLKIRAALRCGLNPILCVGEDEAERAAGRAESVVLTQLLRGLQAVEPGEAARLQVVYEPVWAIGTGHAATAAQAVQMHDLIRREIRTVFGKEAAGVRVLYGGSVTPHNVDELMNSPGIDGVLVGGASLKAGDFARIAAFQSAA
ncbi:MAG TPA: triose-phosphate isomerase [Candidatus Polarisedimenticolia bacterium]|nr:triose-phosphate isomerase [Candidatus Polarisedimenticolia bacterium]